MAKPRLYRSQVLFSFVFLSPKPILEPYKGWHSIAIITDVHPSPPIPSPFFNVWQVVLGRDIEVRKIDCRGLRSAILLFFLLGDPVLKMGALGSESCDFLVTVLRK